MKLSELEFRWDDKYQFENERKENIISMSEIYNSLALIYDCFKLENSIYAENVSLGTWKDHDGWNHLIFIKNEIKDSDRKCYSEFYDNSVGSGIQCSRFSAALMKHHICKCHVEGFEDSKIDWITVVSFLKINFHAGYTYMMRLLMDWLYLTEV